MTYGLANILPGKPQFTVDACGRLYMRGAHVGWVKKDAGHAELLELCEYLDCQLPGNLDGMFEMSEGGQDA